jgi:hypothetical protein
MQCGMQILYNILIMREDPDHSEPEPLGLDIGLNAEPDPDISSNQCN